ncbi:MAG: hypothetical protein ACI4V2_06125 [Alloprevotella sp.]
MKIKTYIQPKSLCIDLTTEQMIATSPSLSVNNDTEVTDLTNQAASNRKGFAGGMWDNME